MNDYIIKTLFFHNMMFDLKGHIRSNKALYVYIFSSNNSTLKPLFSLYASLSLLSLLFFFSHSLPPPSLPSTPLNWRNKHPKAMCRQKNFKGELLLTVSLLPSPSLTLSLSFLSFFFTISPHNFLS